MHIQPSLPPMPPSPRVPASPPRPPTARTGPWTRRAAFLQIPIGVLQFLPVMALIGLPLSYMEPLAWMLAFLVAALPFALQVALRRGNGAAVFVLLFTETVMVGLAIMALSNSVEIAKLRHILLIYLPFGLIGVLSLLAAEIEIFRAGRT